MMNLDRKRNLASLSKQSAHWPKEGLTETEEQTTVQ